MSVHVLFFLSCIVCRVYVSVEFFLSLGEERWEGRGIGNGPDALY